MENKKIKFPIAAILFLVNLVFNFIALIINYYYSYLRTSTISVITDVLLIAILLGVTILLFKRKCNNKLLIFTGLLILPSSINLLRYFSINNVITLLNNFLIFYLVCVAILPQFAVFKNLAKKFYYVPAIISLCLTLYNTVVTYISCLKSNYYDTMFSLMFAFSAFVTGLLLDLSILFLLKWCFYPYENVTNDKIANNTKIERTNIMNNNFENSNAVLDYNESYCELVKHILLSLFTFGIWMYIWIYRTTRTLNKAPNSEKYDPTSKLLLCMFVPFYMIYWYYKHAEKLDKLNAVAGKKTDNTIMYLLLAIFIPIVPCILMQDNINKLCSGAIVNPGSASVNSDTTSGSYNSVQPKTTVNDELKSVEALKEYKSLLDMGVISQEEFDAKKKQLLGIREKAQALNDLPEF